MLKDASIMRKAPLAHFLVVPSEYFHEPWKMKELEDKNFKQRGTHGTNGKLNTDIHSIVGSENAEIQ